MAKRSQRASRAQSAAVAGPGPVAPAGDGAAAQFVVTRAGEEALAFQLDRVSEIIRIPRLAHMPLAPRSLLGLANMRGIVLPVVGLGRLLGLPESPFDDQARIIVIGRGAPIGFAVDRVERLLAIPAAQLSMDPAGAGRLDPGLLDGVVQGGEGADTIKIINPDRVLQGQFDRIGIASSQTAAPAFTAADGAAKAVESRRQTALVSFELGAQEYALPLERVREIVPMPDYVSEIAGSETAVLGVVTSRNRLLPLVSLRALLGLREPDHRESGKVIVVSMGSGSVGIVTDRTREILRVDPALIDPAPALLTRGAGEAEIESICRVDGGRRLVAVLSPDRLFRNDLVRKVLSEAGNDNDGTAVAEGDMADEQFIVFKLGAQEYGLPISAVAEIARVPEQITRMPKAPAFIDGIVNLRGTVLPIVDLRRRFGLVSGETTSGRRILVLAAGGVPTGFVVDSVSEVLKVAVDAIQAAPELSREQMRLIGRVVNLKAQSRIILLIDPTQLLTEGEASVVAELTETDMAPALQSS